MKKTKLYLARGFTALALVIFGAGVSWAGYTSAGSAGLHFAHGLFPVVVWGMVFLALWVQGMITYRTYMEEKFQWDLRAPEREAAEWCAAPTGAGHYVPEDIFAQPAVPGFEIGTYWRASLTSSVYCLIDQAPGFARLERIYCNNHADPIRISVTLAELIYPYKQVVRAATTAPYNAEIRQTGPRYEENNGGSPV